MEPCRHMAIDVEHPSRHERDGVWGHTLVRATLPADAARSLGVCCVAWFSRGSRRSAPHAGGDDGAGSLARRGPAAARRGVAGELGGTRGCPMRVEVRTPCPAPPAGSSTFSVGLGRRSRLAASRPRPCRLRGLQAWAPALRLRALRPPRAVPVRIARRSGPESVPSG